MITKTIASGCLTFADLQEHATLCTACSLRSGVKGVCFGAGDPEADIMFIGEAPGFNEDLTGVPFTGRAGEVLTNIISAMGFTREQVYIANIIKCKPPNNRDPVPHEIELCTPWLERQIDFVSPRIIYAVGKFASQFLTGQDLPMGRMRGRLSEYKGTLVMPVWHTAYILRNPSPERKQELWDDIIGGMQAIGLVPARGISK